MTPPSSDPAPSDNGGCLGSLLFAGVIGWVLVVCIVVQAGGWFADQILLIEGLPVLGGWWLAVGLGQAVLLAPPVVLLLFFTRAPRLRAAYQAWTVAIAALAVFSLARVFAITRVQAAVLTDVILALLATAGLALVLRARGRAPTDRPTGLAAALILVPLVIFPLLLWGSLGSRFDTFLNLLGGLALGLLAGILLDALLLRPVAQNSHGPWRDLSFAAVSSGVALVILGSGFGFNGSQLLLLLALPPLGLAAAALGLRAARQQCAAWPAIALLV